MAVHAETARLKRRTTLQAAMLYAIGLGVAFAMAGIGVLLAPILGLGWSLLVVAGILVLAGAVGMSILAAQK